MTTTTRHCITTLLATALTLLSGCAHLAFDAPGYAVVVSQATLDTPGWSEVVHALEEKYPGAVRLVYHQTPQEQLAALRALHPRYTCFVARPEEAGRDFVVNVHALCRNFDDDPYTDTLWAILTGYDAANALRIAQCREPLTVRKVASGTEIALEMIEQGGWYDELEAGKRVWKEAGGEPVQSRVPQDSTRALVDTLNAWRADCFVTSGHATERDWQLGYRYRNGYFKCEAGVIYGEDTAKRRHPVDSPNPKVYLPIGNCLMGHIDSRDAMALAWMNSAGVNQMIGYIQPTWFGYAGWGSLDYFIEQPGRYTFIEAFFANHHALMHRLQSEPDSKGLLFDRDHVAVYGDPAWVARTASMACRWEQSLTESEGLYTLTITPNRGRESFLPVNTNGSQRGGRPVVAFLPKRGTGRAVVIEGARHQPVVADDFILVPSPGSDYDALPITVRFRFAEAAAPR